MNGLHACKPGNEPVVGQVKTFTVEQRTSASGKAWTKIKSASAEMGGQPYKIMSAKPTGHTDSYGNISFNLDIEPSSGGGASQGASVPQSQSVGAAPSAKMSKDDYWARKEARDLEKDPRIERQHSQEMALRWFAMIGGIPGEPKEYTKHLRAMIDWFQRDISLMPIRTEPEPQAPPDDDGPPI